MDKDGFMRLLDQIEAYRPRLRESQQIYAALLDGRTPPRVGIHPNSKEFPWIPRELGLTITVKQMLNDPHLMLEVKLRGLLWRLQNIPGEDVGIAGG